MSNNRAELLKKSLMKFYKSKENIDKITGVIEKETEHSVSLRVIEWFCNNYSKKHDTIYNVNGAPFNVYLSYKAQLASYQKKQFDPFKRKHTGFETFPLKTGKDTFILTTVGQLNFFRWCIMNKVIDYVQKHLKEIKDDMVKYTKVKSKKTATTTKTITPQQPTRKKRQPLTSTRTCIKRYTKAVLVF